MTTFKVTENLSALKGKVAVVTGNYGLLRKSFCMVANLQQEVQVELVERQSSTFVRMVPRSSISISRRVETHYPKGLHTSNAM